MSRSRGYLPAWWFVLWLIASALAAPPHARAGDCEYLRVSKVIDGDTFVVENGERVRLLGIDTPETVDPRAEVEWFGKEAAEKLRGLIEGRRVCLKRDRDRTIDRGKYNRLLRYAWVGDTFVNKELILQGYAFAYTRYPFQYMEDFRRYQEIARRKGLGLWNNERKKQWMESRSEAAALALRCGQDGTICPRDARNFVGLRKTVRLLVRKSYDAGDRVFLNSENDYRDPENFTVMIMDPPAGIVDRFQGRVIDVRGRIRLYRGRAEITLRDLSSISVVQP